MTRMIGIGGPSGSGKSCLAREIALALGAPVLDLDSYYRDLSNLPIEQRSTTNFDHPDALDWPLLRDHLYRFSLGKPVVVPRYDFATHTRAGEAGILEPAPFLVIEGIFAIYDAAVREQLTLKVFMDLENAICLERRLARDVLQRGRTPESVLQQYQSTVLPSFLEFIAPTRGFADVIIRGDTPLPESSARVLAHPALQDRDGLAAVSQAFPEGQQLPEHQQADL